VLTLLLVLVETLLVVTELVLFDVELVSTKLLESYAPWLIGLMVLVVVPLVVLWVLVFCAKTELKNITKKMLRAAFTARILLPLFWIRYKYYGTITLMI
jgi:hypothetical protein